MNRAPIRQKADRLRALPLPAVLRVWGAQPDPHDRHKWRTPQGVLSVTGAKFMNWTHGVGGGGAIDLVLHLNRCAFREALAWLADHFPSPPLGTDLDLVGLAPPPLQLPTPAPARWTRVRHYLLEQRRLDAHLIDRLLQSGSLYADPHANAVFVLRGEHDRAVGAELRGTTAQAWRGMAPGSKKDWGFFSMPPLPFPGSAPATGPSTIVLCESAIDALSCHLLHPHLACVSTAGARPNPRWLGPLLAQGYTVHCGFDTDPTGESMAQAMIALHPQVRRLAPSAHDWNDVLRFRP